MVVSPVWGLESAPCGPFSWYFSLGTSRTWVFTRPQQVLEEGPQQVPEFPVWLWLPQCSTLNICSSPKSQFLLTNSGIPLDSSCIPLHVLWPENCLWAVVCVSGTTGFCCVMPIVSCGFSLLQARGDSCPYRSVLARSRSSYLFFECWLREAAQEM